MPASWGVMVSFLILAVFGGVFSVPMYAIMQAESSDDRRARVVACLNIMNSLFMVLSAVFCYVLLKMKFSITGIFLAVGVVNLLVTPLLSRLAGNGDVKNG
jgi:MFS family permease